jgi:hypothetical protein
MYQFTSIKQEDLFNSSKIADLQLFSEFNEVQIQGILQRLFGKPFYETSNYENAYSYMIKATDSSDSSLLFEVYQGSSGCAIGGQGIDSEMNKAITEFKQLLLTTKPEDFYYEGYYMDAHVKIICGIDNGKIIYEEIALEEDEIGDMKINSSEL